MNELFFIGERGSIFFLHQKKGVKTLWRLGTHFEKISKSNHLMLDRVRPNLRKGETAEEQKARRPNVNVRIHGKKIIKMRDVRFFAENFSLMPTYRYKEFFLLGINENNENEIVFCTTSKGKTILWKMTEKGFQLIAKSENVSISRLQPFSMQEMEKMSDQERRRARNSPPKIVIRDGEKEVLNLKKGRFFVESSPMSIDLR